MVCELCAYGGSASQGGMHLAEIIGRDEQADCRLVVFQFAGPSQTKADEPLVEMANGQIRPLHMAGANSVPAWIASLDLDFNPLERGRGISALGFHLTRRCGELFYHNGIVQPLQKVLADDGGICRKGITCDLDSANDS